MFNGMRLSVVIPTFDTAPLTVACCASVIAALPPDSEVIVVDDGSSDGTADAIRSAFPSIRILRNESNRGFAVSANRGVNAATGDVILLLNSDTAVLPGALEILLEAFEADPSLGVAGAQLVGSSGEPQWSGGPLPGLLWLAASFSGAGPLLRRFRGPRQLADRDVDWVCGAAMAMRRAVWDAFGPLREDFEFYAQDLDFCERAGKGGWKIRLLAAARVQHVGGATFGSGVHAEQVRRRDLLRWYREHRGGLPAALASLLARL